MASVQGIRRSIISRILLLFVLVFMVLAGLIVTASGIYLQHQSQQLISGQLLQYIRERGERERDLFLQAADNLHKVADRFNKDTLSGLQPSDMQFDLLFSQRDDGSWRSRAGGFDPELHAGVFVDDDTPLSEEVRVRISHFYRLTSNFGAAMVGRFANLYMIGKENYLAVYWPEVNWAEQVTTAIRMPQEPYYSVGNKVNNPERKVVWTPVYYDAVAKRWMISAVYPLDYQGRQIASIGQDLLLDDLIARVTDQVFPGSYNLIVHRDGTLLAHPLYMDRVKEMKGSFNVAEAADAALSDLYRKVLPMTANSMIIEDEQSGRLLAVSYLPETQWFFVTVYPLQYIPGGFDRPVMLLTALLIIAMLCLCALLYWRLKKQVSLPLTHVAAHLSEQSVFQPVAIRIDQGLDEELYRLATIINEIQQQFSVSLGKASEELGEQRERLLKKEHEVRDIEQKAELRNREYLQLNSRMKRVSEELQQLREQLVESEKMTVLARLVASVAHDVNTPVGVSVTAVSTLTEELQEIKGKLEDGNLSKSDFKMFIENADEVGRILQVNLKRAAELIRGFKQIAVDQSSDTLRQFDLRDYLSEVLMSLAPRLKRLPHQILLECDEGIVMNSYPGALSQVITNMVMNSVIHGFDDQQAGEILIRAKAEQTTVLLEYSDDGCGLDEEQLLRIFEPFYTTRREQGGSGLGTHIIYSLVTGILQGKIDCNSEPAKGITYLIEIPLEIDMELEQARAATERL